MLELLEQLARVDFLDAEAARNRQDRCHRRWHTSQRQDDEPPSPEPSLGDAIAVR
jgi:hypothetical protein